MSRNVEVTLLTGAALLAAFGVTLVNFASGRGPDAASATTLLVLGIAFLAIHFSVRRFAPDSTSLLVTPVALLVSFGFIEVYRLNPDAGTRQKWWLVVAAAGGVVLLAALSRHGVVILRRFRNIALVASLVLHALPMLPDSWPIHGSEVNGSRLWVTVEMGLFRLNFQPGEIAKLLFVVFLAAYLADRKPVTQVDHKRITLPEVRLLVPLVAVWLASLGILVFERDLGASLLLFFVFVTVVYSATGKAGYLITGTVMGAAGGVAAWALFDHIQRRVVGWLNPLSDYTDAGYQISQAMFAMANGSLAGAGPGMGHPNLIPAAETDFVFAAIAEEFGFAGSVAVLSLYCLVIGVGFGIALGSRDRFRKLLATGLTISLAIQTLLILGGILRLFPLTGITLPFVSYGGSSLVGNFLLVALLLRISHEEAE